MTEARMPIVWQALLWFVAALLVRLVWVWVVPAWQAPDEPLHYEYAAVLAGRLRGTPVEQARAAAQQEILQALQAAGFWTLLGEPTPDPLPATFAGASDPYLGRAGTQVGDEPPLYYLAPALTVAWVPGMITQLRLMRLFSALLTSLTVPITWAAARELWPGRPALAFTAAAAVLALPMYAFIGSSANNDALLILLASLLAWCIVRGSVRGWTVRRLIGLVLVLAGGLLAKKLGLALLPAGCVALWQALSARLAPAWRKTAAVLVALGAVALVVWLMWPVPDQPASWARRGFPAGYGARAAGAAHSGAHALVVPAPEEGGAPWIAQMLSDGGSRRLRGQQVVLRAWLRADALTEARLILDDGVSTTELPVLARSDWQEATLEASIAADADEVRVILTRAPGPAAADRPAADGSIYFDDVSLTGRGREWLANGSAESAKRRGEGVAAGWLRLPPWYLRGMLDPSSYDGEALQRFARYAALLFPGFWGNFGWLSVPMPVWVYGLIAAACAVAGAGWLRGRLAGAAEVRRRPEAGLPKEGLRRAWRLLALLVACVLLAALLPMIGREWQPQGRYLFPALTPLALVWAKGWAGWGPVPNRRGWSRWWLVPNLLMAALVVGALLGVVIPYYYPAG